MAHAERGAAGVAGGHTSGGRAHERVERHTSAWSGTQRACERRGRRPYPLIIRIWIAQAKRIKRPLTREADALFARAEPEHPCIEHRPVRVAGRVAALDRRARPRGLVAIGVQIQTVR